MRVAVQLPDDVASGLVADGQASDEGSGRSESRGGFADLAAYAAVFAGDGATVVTLLTTPDVIGAVARRLCRRPKTGRWLNARGPGGEVNLRLHAAIDESVVTGLLTAIWDGGPDA